MIDCPNVEMRDRLPDRANDTLVVAERELVLAHLTDCAACTAEIEILRTTRLILLKTTPKVNVPGIVSALPQYGVKSVSSAPSARRGWANSWRVVPLQEHEPPRRGDQRLGAVFGLEIAQGLACGLHLVA